MSGHSGSRPTGCCARHLAWLPLAVASADDRAKIRLADADMGSFKTTLSELGSARPRDWRPFSAAPSIIDEIERRSSDEILGSRQRAKIAARTQDERVRLRVVEPQPIGHRRVDVDDHDVSPVRRGAVAARSIDPSAAHRRSERTCGSSGRCEKARVERRSLRASIRGMPPDDFGGGSGRSSSHRLARRYRRREPARLPQWPQRLRVGSA